MACSPGTTSPRWTTSVRSTPRSSKSVHSPSARQGIPRRATDSPPRRIGEHYGVPISVQLVEIAEQDTPEATGFDRLKAGDIDSMALSAANRWRTDVPPCSALHGNGVQYAFVHRAQPPLVHARVSVVLPHGAPDCAQDVGDRDVLGHHREHKGFHSYTMHRLSCWLPHLL